MRKYLHIFKDDQAVNVVTYLKSHGTWRAIGFDRDKFMSIMLHEPLKTQRDKLLQKGMTWEWSSSSKKEIE